MRTTFPILALVTLLFSGCASTSVSSFRDPAVKMQSVKSIVVMADFADLAVRQSIERRFEQELSMFEVRVIKSIDLMPPTKEYPVDVVAKTLKTSGCDGCLLVSLEDYYQTSLQVGGYGAQTSGQAIVTGNQVNYSSETTISTPTTFYYPNAKCAARLVDLGTGQVAWLAKTHTMGAAVANMDDLIRSGAKSVVSEMAKAGFLAPRRR